MKHQKKQISGQSLKKNSKKPDGFPIILKVKKSIAGQKTIQSSGAITGVPRLTIKKYLHSFKKYRDYRWKITNGITFFKGFKRLKDAIKFTKKWFI